MLDKLEKISKLLFTTGSFDDSNIRLQISAVVKFGSKGKDDKRLSPIYTREYESSNYTNRNTLKTSSISTGDYIVFTYTDFDNNETEEVYISYPHLEVFKNFISDVYDMVVNPDTCVFNNKNRIKKGLEDEQIIPDTSFVNDSLIWAIPYADQRTDDSPVERFAVFYINDEDKYMLISEAGVKSLYETFVNSNFNLLLVSLSLTTIALLSDKNNYEDDDKSSPAGRNNRPKPRPGRNKSKPNNRKPSKKLKEEDEEEDYDEELEDDEDEEEEEEEETPKKRPSSKKSSSKGKSKKSSGKKTSFNRILEEAKEIEMDDEDLELDDDEE